MLLPFTGSKLSADSRQRQLKPFMRRGAFPCGEHNRLLREYFCPKQGERSQDAMLGGLPKPQERNLSGDNDPNLARKGSGHAFHRGGSTATVGTG